MEKIDWKEMAIVGSHYSGALYISSRGLVIKSGFYVAKRLFKILDAKLKIVSVTKENNQLFYADVI